MSTMDPDTTQPDPGSQIASTTKFTQLATLLTVEDVLPAVSERPFQFEDLPAELRVNVYQCLLPCGVDIELDGDRVRWRHKDQGITTWQSKGLIKGGISLFLVNKFISNEARPILYGSNHYHLRFDAHPRHPRSLQSPDVFGLLGVPHRLPLLRDLRSICITLDPKTPDTLYWGHQRHRGRLSLFTKILREHAHDSNQKSLLKALEVRLLPPFDIATLVNDLLGHVGWAHGLHLVFQEMKEQSQYALEELLPLRGIEEVSINGAGSRFSACVQLYLRGKGGEVNTKQYDDKVVRRRSKDGNRWIKQTVSSRKWHEPEYDWDEFAERNKLLYLSRY